MNSLGIMARAYRLLRVAGGTAAVCFVDSGPRHPSSLVQTAANMPLTSELVFPLTGLTPASTIVGIALDARGNLVVLSSEPELLTRFSPDGKRQVLASTFDLQPNQAIADLGGPAVAPDGRIVLWHGPSHRVLVLAENGSSTSSWAASGTDRSARVSPLIDSLGRLYLPMATSREDSGTVGRIVRFPSITGGQQADSIVLPRTGARLKFAVVTTTTGLRVAQAIPFYPVAHYQVSTGGAILWATGEQFDVFSRSGSGDELIIHRTGSPVPVAADEQREQQDLLTYMNRVTDPTWTWTGPPIPEHHASIEGLQADAQGRIWLIVPLPSVLLPKALQRPRFSGRADSPLIRWARKQAFELFSAEGRFIGRTAIPDGADVPLLVSKGNRVWIPRRNPKTLGFEMVRYRLGLPK